LLQVEVFLNAAALSSEFSCASAFSPGAAQLLGPGAWCAASGTVLTITLGTWIELAASACILHQHHCWLDAHQQS
jgi:hypothetical protein